MLLRVMAKKHQASPPAILEIAAWIGTGLILSGYGLFSLGLLPEVVIYHAMNLVGSVTVATIAFYRRVWQLFVLNCAFALFATFAILKELL